MIVVTDQLNRKIKVHEGCTIVSLVPSQTELLYTLGCGDRVVGITKFCIHPNEWFVSKTRIGGTKNIQIDKVKSINPGLIIANKEENTKEQIEELAKHFPVYVSDVNTLSEAYEMISSIGEVVGKKEESEELIREIKGDFKKLPQINKKCLYFIWKNPYMVVGNNTFIGNILQVIGFENCLTNPAGRYDEISVDEIKKMSPEILLLSSEPYPFKEKDVIELESLTGVRTIIVDGELFSWYGSRMQKMPKYYQELHTQIKAI